MNLPSEGIREVLKCAREALTQQGLTPPFKVDMCKCTFHDLLDEIFPGHLHSEIKPPMIVDGITIYVMECEGCTHIRSLTP